MTCPEATLAYQSGWLSLLGFFLPITFFNRKQCEKLQTPVYQAIPPKMGYNRYIPLEVQYGPKNYGRAGLTHAYTEQAIKHEQYLTGTIQQQSQLAYTFMIALSTIQLAVGTGEFFLNMDKKRIP